MKKTTIEGGFCPILPMQLCIIWAATQEGAVTKLARDVWFAALTVQFWRCKNKPGQPYRRSPRGFRVADIAKVLGVGETQLRGPLRQLDQAGILRITDEGPWFATSLSDLSVPDPVIGRIRTMFDQLHPHTRDKVIAVPRRLLKVIVQCGRKTVRLATLLGLLLRMMLEKRTDQYGSHKGCCKAQWIAEVFGVGVDRVKTERRHLIREGWFTEEPTPPQVQKRYGLWLRLHLTPTPCSPKPVDPDHGTPTEAEPAKVEPQPCSKPLKLQPLSNQQLPSNEGILNNQKLSEDTPPGVEPSQAIAPKQKPTWTDIAKADLHLSERRLGLFEDAVTRGVLQNTSADRLTFLSAIARTLHKATHNAGGFLRRLIETPDYRGFITQADEETARQWLGASERMEQPMPMAQPEEGTPSLSKDALTVQVLLQDLKPVRYTGHPLALIQRTGYLSDWTRERWDHAALELATVRRPGQSLPYDIGRVMDAMVT
jgi:hypothetical protein